MVRRSPLSRCKPSKPSAPKTFQPQIPPETVRPASVLAKLPVGQQPYQDGRLAGSLEPGGPADQTNQHGWLELLAPFGRGPAQPGQEGHHARAEDAQPPSLSGAPFAASQAHGAEALLAFQQLGRALKGTGCHREQAAVC